MEGVVSFQLYEEILCDINPINLETDKLDDKVLLSLSSLFSKPVVEKAIELVAKKKVNKLVYKPSGRILYQIVKIKLS